MTASPLSRSTPHPHSFAAQQLVAHLRAARVSGTAPRRRAVPLTRPPTLIESDYAARLVAIVDRMRTAAQRLVAELPSILRTDSGIRLDDDPGAQARAAAGRMRAEVDGSFDPNAFEHIAEGFGRRVSEHQRGELGRQAKAALGVDVVNLDPKIPPLIRGFAHENVSLIKKLQGSALDHIETLVTRAVTSGTRAEVVSREIEARFGISERHARLIARDQIGKLNGQITAARHQELGIGSFRWRSMHDPKVRPLHRVLDGQQFSYDKLPAEGLPGTPIACRCLQEPVFDEILAAAAGAPGIPGLAAAEPDIVSPYEDPDVIESPGVAPEPAGMPEGFSVHVEVDGARLFADDPAVIPGIPTFGELDRAAYRRRVYVTAPSQIAHKKLYGIDTGGDTPTDPRTASILEAWRSSHVLAALEIDVDAKGNYFVADGNHRLWAAAFSGDRPVAVRFHPVEAPIDRMDPIAERLREVLAARES